MNCDKKYDILLTGGTGFFGKSILSMKQRGFLPEFRFAVLSREPELFCQRHPEFANFDDVTFFKGDIRDFSFPDREFDFILHCAAPSTVETAEVYHDIIVNGTAHILDFAKNSKIKKMLYISSGAVYSPDLLSADKIKEDFPCKPVSSYGKAKYAAEQLCLNSTVPVVIARCFSFIGTYILDKKHLAVSSFINACLLDESIVINGDGSPLRSYMGADELVLWLFKILLKGRCGEIYNVGSDREISVLELAKSIHRIFNSSKPIIVQNNTPRSDTLNCYVPDVTKCFNEFGLSVNTDLHNEILKLVSVETKYE